jgi:hypothetical protein
MNFSILFGIMEWACKFPISLGFFVGLQQTLSANTWTQTLWFFCFFFCTDCVCQDRSEGWASWNHCFYYWEGHGRVHPDSRKLRTLGVNVLIYFTYMFVGVFFLSYVEFQIVKFSIDSRYLDKKIANRFWGMFCLSHGSCRFTTAQKLDKLGMRGSDT